MKIQKIILNEFNDSYISPEIILYSSLNNEKSDTSEILKRYNISKENLKLAIIKHRKGQTINESNSKIDSNVLEKFSINLTDLAKTGRLDPVIGRGRNKKEYSSSFKKNKK